ncbi:TIGR03620 family F420-dependent LLM class oxidoreductase [Aquihabitans sp. G128]|uniref:TIGR03620 family F420-dependent LLM class oxidoreductase n=1 Tax=Aquihabitans sp. G128 TaxID=2849779 RepID=UPI001C216411|nr:TIGR03620 family F420-dependent LLM class oxidoreductase [Aquihabitans sp. G128]QXC63305.1 TIGR03620 family F420-dependent LLM class oxidoreductase [Aquihabitans sp. G128]
MDIGRIGIWTHHLDLAPSAQAVEHVDELDELGFGAVWVPEAVGREAFTNAALLLRGGTDITVATGIASIWARDAMAAAAAHKTVTEAYPDRFLLGLGVSHEVMVAGIRGHDYSKPFSAMRDYLKAMDEAMFFAAPPTTEPRRVLAALRPKMLGLARDHAQGAHPYFVPPEHTAVARAELGEGPLLAVEQAVVLETDPEKARALARTHTQTYVGLPNYVNNLRELIPSLTEDDFANAGSDRLVDTIVAWGTVDTAVERVQAHLDAGADHVCIQVIQEGAPAPLEAWRALSDAFSLRA